MASLEYLDRNYILIHMSKENHLLNHLLNTDYQDEAKPTRFAGQSWSSLYELRDSARRLAKSSRNYYLSCQKADYMVS